MTLPGVDDLKAQAKRLRAALADNGRPLTHSQSLELVARQYGFRDWNTACALAGSGRNRPFSVGDRVSGTYLSQPFTGEIVGLQKLGPAGNIKVTLKFDEPVDVVTFDSFSAFRSRVTCVTGPDGTAASKTSDGEPHLRMRPVSA